MDKYKPNISVCLQIINENKVLLMRRFNTSYEDGKYEFPSGHIEAGETLAEGVVREALEEVGLIVKEENLEFVGFVDNHASGKHVNFLFRTSKFDGTPKIMEPNECDDLAWKNLDELTLNIPDLSIDTKRFIEMIKEGSVYKAY
ncbi:MAG: NUDIX domain-containing protein [Oscillospiraceae bacterium]|nr:NUDIX domain-containing protein [Oscillospiraceae bacterium]